MSINFENPEIQSILQNNAIEQHYSLDCMPTKLVDPSTDKANRCLYEKLDPSNYESGARMVAFRTFHERIVPWIKILNLYYYELMGKQNDKMVSWVDNPQTISPGQKLQSIIIDVKNANDERQYKITFFVKSGLIQAQGNHYHEFATKDFPALLSIMHHLSGPLPVIGSQPTTVSPSYEPQSRGNSETGVEVQTSVESEQTCLKLPPNKEHNVILDSTQVNIQKVNPQDNTHVKKISDKISDEVQCDMNNNLVNRSDIDRLEDAFVNALFKLEQATTNNKNEIIGHIKSLSMPNDSSTEKMKTSDTISSLETKLRNMKDENKSLEQQLHTVKANLLLREELHEQTLTHERKLLSEAQEQQRRCIAEKNEDHDYLQNQLKYKMAENESLTQTIKDLTTKLNISKDEIIQLKTSMASSIHEELRAPTNLQPPTKIQQPSVLLIGTSNIEGIKADKLTTVANVQKTIQYTMKDTSTYLQTVVIQPTVLVLHSLTNDLKKKNPQQCVNDLFELVTTICAKWPLVKVVISFTTPRCDTLNNSTSAQIINVLLRQKFLGVDNIFFTEHPNMLVNGIPNKDLLQPDGIHLNDKGISLLAGNIKRAIHIALDIPPPPRRSRSKSPGRRGRRQYQNYP